MHTFAREQSKRPGQTPSNAVHISRLALTSLSKPQVQRACSCGGRCPKCRDEGQGEEHDHVHRMSESTVGQKVPTESLHGIANSHGKPLEAGTRSFFEPRFGH